MIRRLPVLLGAIALASWVGTADAGRFGGGGHFGGGAHFGGGGHFSGGFHAGGGFHASAGFHGGYRGWSGGVHVGGSGYVHWSSGGFAYRPTHWHWGGHVWVGGYRYHPWWPSYYYFYPSYVPSYYGETYYPVEPTYAAPSVAAAVAPEPPLPRFGVGVFGGAVDSDLNTATNTKESDFGLLGRYRLTTGLLVEGELGKTSYDVANKSNVRVDRRLGGSLIYEIGAYNRLAPYILGGLGVQQADVAGTYSTTQDYAELGVGLRFAITPNLHLAFDVRAGTRSTVSNDQTAMMPSGTVARSVTPPTTDSGQSEDYTRGRLSAILYF